MYQLKSITRCKNKTTKPYKLALKWFFTEQYVYLQKDNGQIDPKKVLILND